MKLEPVILEGKNVRLETLKQKDAGLVWQAVSDPEIWRYIPIVPSSEEQTRGFLAMGEQRIIWV